MSAKNSSLGYLPRSSPIHSLTGATKLIMTILCSIAVMITYDTRFLAGMILLAIGMFALSKIRFREIWSVVVFITIFMIINVVAITLFSPEEGVKIYGTRHEIGHLFGNYYLTQEQLFYLLNVVLKYFSVLPMAILFITTTQPSEFASSLNRIGVSYKIAYSVALTLRYIPDIKRDYVEISQAQQARGIDISRNVSLSQRVRNVSFILLPLVLSSLSRIDTITNAMELRGFGKHPKRTWYSARPFRRRDFAAIGICVLLLIVSILMNVRNHGRFFNPFTAS